MTLIYIAVVALLLVSTVLIYQAYKIWQEGKERKYNADEDHAIGLEKYDVETLEEHIDGRNELEQAGAETMEGLEQ